MNKKEKMEISQKEEQIIDLKNGIILQQLNKDMLWYVLRDNRIIDYGQYRSDLIEKWK